MLTFAVVQQANVVQIYKEIAMNKIFYVFMFLTCQLLLVSCAAGQVYGSTEIQKHLESLIGRKYDFSVGWGAGWQKIFEDAMYLELEFVRKSGCSYAIRIRKDTSTVDGWRFTSSRSSCDDNYSPDV